jgi:uncharacterized membrane protein
VHPLTLEITVMTTKMDATQREHLTQLREKSADEHDALIRDPKDSETEATFGDQLAGKITSAIATWKFILIQTGIIIAWTAYNMVTKKSGFDPYPFILLNLFLSFQSAYTAPAIMMSQKRQARNDQIRNEMESDINVKADLELSRLQEKIDHISEKDLAEIKGKISELTLLVERLTSQEASKT